eukprot:2163927-Rhodomonas_salina.1
MIELSRLRLDDSDNIVAQTQHDGLIADRHQPTCKVTVVQYSCLTNQHDMPGGCQYSHSHSGLPQAITQLCRLGEAEVTVRQASRGKPPFRLGLATFSVIAQASTT